MYRGGSGVGEVELRVEDACCVSKTPSFRNVQINHDAYPCHHRMNCRGVGKHRVRRSCSRRTDPQVSESAYKPMNLNYRWTLNLFIRPTVNIFRILRVLSLCLLIHGFKKQERTRIGDVIYIYVYIYMYIYNMYIYICIYICIYKYIYNMYIYMYTYIYIFVLYVYSQGKRMRVHI